MKTNRTARRKKAEVIDFKVGDLVRFYDSKIKGGPGVVLEVVKHHSKRPKTWRYVILWPPKMFSADVMALPPNGTYWLNSELLPCMKTIRTARRKKGHL